MIRASQLTKDYGLNRAVDTVSFDISKGDIVGLLGPNGSGKTTIMRMLTGFFSPTAGTCSIAGYDVTQDSLETRRRVGYLPERVALYPDMSVRAYLRFVARIREVRTGIRGCVGEAIEKCGLREVARKHIGKLSRGYRQRVGIAQAIVHRPDVLILDEPTVGLDPRQIVEIRSLIRSLAGDTTVLLSTHILPEVSIACRRVLILDRGRLIAEDTSEGLTQKTAGRGETLVQLRAPEEAAATALRRCRDVREVEILERGPQDWITLLVRSQPGVEVRPALAREVVAQGWDLGELSPRLMSLEDLFVEILARAEQGDGEIP